MEKRTLNKLLLILFFINISFTNLLFSNNFLKSKIRLGELKLYFESNIEKVTYFKLPQADGTTKYVYDIYGGVLTANRGISHHTFRTIESFRMGQNSSTLLRVVIKSEERDLDKHQFKGNVLAIPLIYSQKSTFSGTAIPLLKEESKKREVVQQKFVSQESSFGEVDEINPYIIVIDAGHGGKDTGASCCGDKKEKEVVLSISLKLKKRLERKGYKVYMTRHGDSFVKLPKRTEFANKKRADIFVSIHANAAPTKKVQNIFKGLEIYYLSPAKTERAKKAAAKENAVMFKGKDFYTKNAYLSLISETKIVESHKLGLDVSYKILSNVRTAFGHVADGGVKPANFWVLVGAQMPAILVETGYITHPEEGENLMNSYYKGLLAKGVAEGIDRYLSHK
jgi:N-acetylmuramoyl-L-alanine amidase